MCKNVKLKEHPSYRGIDLRDTLKRQRDRDQNQISQLPHGSGHTVAGVFTTLQNLSMNSLKFWCECEENLVGLCVEGLVLFSCGQVLLSNKC